MADAPFQVEVVGLSELIESFKKAPSVVQPILVRAVQASAAVLAKNTAKGNVPFRTGFLTRSFMGVADSTGLAITWRPTASYAPFVQFGHRQTSGRYVKAIGKRLVRSFVPANPFLERIMAASKPGIDDLFARAGQQIAQALI